MTSLTDSQWSALAVAFTGGAEPVPDGSFTVGDIVEAARRAGRPIEVTTARLRVRKALAHGLIVCVREHAGTQPARYAYADGKTAQDAAAILREG